MQTDIYSLHVLIRRNNLRLSLNVSVNMKTGEENGKGLTVGIEGKPKQFSLLCFSKSQQDPLQSVVVMCPAVHSYLLHTP